MNRRAEDLIDCLMRPGGREALHAAQRARALRRWPTWRKFLLPEGVPHGDGWTRDVRLIAVNSIFSVLIRPLPALGDGAAHAMISTVPGDSEPTWSEKQRIKDFLFSPAARAVEVFPPQRELVDGADAYHLWILPVGMPWPFSLAGEPAPTNLENPGCPVCVGEGGHNVPVRL